MNKIFVRKKWNVIFDAKIRSICDETLIEVYSIMTDKSNQSEKDLRVWIEKTGFRDFLYKSKPNKKVLEFFFSYQLLQINDANFVLDAAGGESKYLFAVKKLQRNTVLVLQDHIYDGIKNKDGIKIVGGDISSILLPDASVDKISCHHAFEHFRANKDQLFIKEIARLLRPKGKAVIIPIFISTKYVESWNINTNVKFDESATTFVDKTASLPGSDADGHFARIYDPMTFKKRICEYAEKIGLKWTLVTCIIDNRDMPDMNVNKGAKINNPLRALILSKS